MKTMTLQISERSATQLQRCARDHMCIVDVSDVITDDAYLRTIPSMLPAFSLPAPNQWNMASSVNELTW